LSKRFILTAGIVLVVTSLFIGFGRSELLQAGQTTTVAPVTVIVIIQKGSDADPRLGFMPVEIHLIIGVNNTVTWKNEDTDWHTAHSNIPEFDSRMIQPGGSFTHTFLKPGIFPYHCDPHPWMTGKITVSSPTAGIIAPPFSIFQGTPSQESEWGLYLGEDLVSANKSAFSIDVLD
jgi:plastocyanin